MFHVDIIPIVTCFTYTSYHFYAFSVTNLLTRCHSASSVFCCFCIPEKLFWKYSRNWTKFGQNLLFSRHVHGVQRRDGGDRGGSHARGRRGPTPCRAGGWRDPLGCLQTPPFRLYNAFVQKTLDTRASIHEKYRSRRRRQP